jgi:hypothetical protein
VEVDGQERRFEPEIEHERRFEPGIKQDVGRFDQVRGVVRVLQLLRSEGVFSLQHLKRQLALFVAERTDLRDQAEMLKPSGTEVLEMYREDMCQSGEALLPAGDCDLRVGEACSEHVRVCMRCKAQGQVSSACYFAKLRRCISHGWKPAVDEASIRPVYEVTENYRSISDFPVSVAKEFHKMVEHGVVEEVPNNTAGVWHPMGAVIKNSDRRKAKALAGIQIVNQESLERASAALQEQGYAAIKARITHDCTASGLNRSALCPPFRYPSLADGLKLVERGSWLGKTDISRYFHQFPLALECRHLFLLRFEEKWWRSRRLLFGFGPCPYYTSIWSAEYRKWLIGMGIPTAHMMDDFFTVGGDEVEVLWRLGAMCAMFERVGHVIQLEKNETGQQLVFLGVLIDTVRMSVSFDATQAKGMLAQLIVYLSKIKEGLDLDLGTIRHVAGCLNWYSEVLQSGRVHLQSWWLYCRYHRHLTIALRLKLVLDTEWWMTVMSRWSQGDLSGREYPILNGSTLIDEGMIWVLQSDASGPDGFGYYYGSLDEENPPYVSRIWGNGYEFISSHHGELEPLLHFLRGKPIRGRALIWLTDSLSAVWSVNKGNCKAEASFPLLEEILLLCDELKMQLLSMWIPREENVYADYLSHLASSLGRKEAAGRSRGLGCVEGVYRGHDMEDEEHGGTSSDGAAVPAMVRRGGPGGFSR